MWLTQLTEKAAAAELYGPLALHARTCKITDNVTTRFANSEEGTAWFCRSAQYTYIYTYVPGHMYTYT